MPTLERIGPPSGVEVPGVVQVPMRSPALEAVERGAQDVEEKSAYLGRMLKHQEVVNALHEGTTTYLTGQGDIKDAALAQHPEWSAEQRRANLTQQSRALMGQVMKDHPLGGDLLQETLTEHQMAFENELRHETLAETIQNARANVKLTNDQAVRGIQQTDDPGVANALRIHAESAIAASPFLAPAEKDLETQKLHSQIAEAQLLRGITKAPAAALLQLSDPEFLKKNPDLTAEHQIELRQKAETALIQPERMANAAIEAKQGAVLQSLIAKASTNSLTGGDLQAAYESGIPADRLKTLMPGFTPAERSDPGLKAAMISIIDRDPTSVSRYEILNSGARGRDLSELDAYLSKKQADIKAPLGKARALATTQVLQTLKPPTMMSINPARTAAERKSLQDAFELYTAEAKNPAEVWRLQQEFIKMNRENPGMFAPGHLGPPPEAAPAPNPGETPAAYVARLRAIGH